jgi:hypothetical protein
LLLALSWTDTIALNTSFVHLTDEGSDSELDEPPESTIKKKLIISAAGDGGSGAEKPVMCTLQQVELQAYYERFVRAVIVKDEQ